MDQQPPPILEARNILGLPGTWIVWVIISIISTSLSALKRAGSIQVAAYWIVLSALIGPGLAVIAVVYWEVNVYVGAVICCVVGLLIAGIAGQLDKLNKRVGDANPNIPFLPHTDPGIVTQGLPPIPPAPIPPPQILTIKEPGK